MSLHKLSAGSGYTYLTRQVAAGDVTARGRGSLGGYYAERGESPGVWLGSGLGSLEGGPRPGDPVSEAQMVALFGHGHHPNAPVYGRPADGGPGVTALGTPFVTEVPRVSVAGYDLTFSPVKSVSALWALADPAVAAQIEAAHHAAVADTIGWLERTAVYTRLGTGGLRQVDVTGLLAVAFTHRDSRAGDPDLHTHVAISNKVATADGRWRALDGRALYAAIVAASERYNTRLEAQLVDRLGVTFRDRATRPGARPVRELAGVPEPLLDAWSARRARIVDRQAELLDRFRSTYRREPTPAEAQALTQQATLATRPGKHAPRSAEEQRRTWQAQAEQLLGAGAAARVVDRALHCSRPSPVASPGWAGHAARTAIATVSAERAVFSTHHVRAELERIARADRVPLRALDPGIEQALRIALSNELSVRLNRDPDPAVPASDITMGAVEPAQLRRRDGASVYTAAHTQLYTTPAVLDAENRILAAADRGDGRRVPAGLVELALLEARDAGRPLNPGQQAMVRELACSGRRVQVALAPAGTGKTTALGMLARAWTDGGGVVLGTAPSAVAAAALAEATGTPAITLAAALHRLNRGRDPGGVPVGPGLLVLVDEAGMAATADLAAVIDEVTAAGGSVRLVGDTGQLASPAAGGILRDLVRTHGAVELDTPVRFTDPAEAAATLSFRAGDPTGLDFYVTHGRIHTPGGAHADADDATGEGRPGRDSVGEALDSALAGWAADRAAGCDSLLLAGSNHTVAELNARARNTRLLTSRNPSPPEVRLRDGTAASPGDLIIARRNEPALRITETESVKNGDRFTVVALTDDGGLEVRHVPSRRRLTLPAGYVTEHLQLGYAATIHLAQGTTVDTTHTVLTGGESREQLYVALSRGRAANHVHLAGGPVGDDDPAHPALARSDSGPTDPLDLVRQVLERSDQRPSANSALADAADPGLRLQTAVERYLDAHTLHTTRTPGAAKPGETGGPLPWLPPPPDPDNGELAAYVQRRADLVHALAGTITDADLPATEWGHRLREADPDLARRLAVWRAATGITDDPHPLGPGACPTPAVRADLDSQLRPHIGADLPRRLVTGHPARSTGPARHGDPQRALGRTPVPEHDPQLARAYHRDREHGRRIRR
ncbi:MAG: TrwC relaxase [Blastococcus sp.]|nr:TrwC relaxase [Blastococcus sp.]